MLGEKYLPVGSTEVDRFIGEIRETQPDFIFNTLIGEFSYAFYRAYAAIGAQDKRVGPARIPVTSCSLSEPELLSIGAPAAAGHIASSVYFQSIDRPPNQRFVTRYRARFGAHEVTSAMQRPHISQSSCWRAPSAPPARPTSSRSSGRSINATSTRRKARCASIPPTTTAI